MPALAALVGFGLIGCRQSRPAPDSKVEQLLAAFASNIDQNFDQAYEPAATLHRLGRERDAPSLQARGLVRMAFAEARHDRWANGWASKLKQSESLCGESKSVAWAEYLMYRGCIRASYLENEEAGYDDVRTAIRLARSLRTDPLLSLAFGRVAELELAQGKMTLAMESAFYALVVAEHVGAEWLERRALEALTRVLGAQSPQLALPYAKQLVDLGAQLPLALRIVAQAELPPEQWETRAQQQLQVAAKSGWDPIVKQSFEAYLNLQVATAASAQGQHVRALALARKSHAALQDLEDERGADEAELFVAKLATIVGELDAETLAVLEAKHRNDPTAVAAKTLGQIQQFRNNTRRSRFWYDLLDKNLGTGLSAASRQLRFGARRFWSNELRNRRVKDASYASQQLDDRIQLTAIFGSAALVIAVLFWRWRRTSRLLRIVRKETERRQTEEDANEVLHKRLFRAQRLESISTLSEGIAHDFSNALTVIAGQAELAQGTTDIDERRRRLAAVLAASSDAARTTRALLTFSRHTVGENHPLVLTEVVRRIYAMMKKSLPAAVELSVDLVTDEPVRVLAVESGIEQILVNLILNAQSALRTGQGAIRIRVRRDSAQPGWGVIEVEDDGVGMPAELQRRLFDPFFSTRERGAGLGLSVVHGIVASFAGEIEVESTPGVGTVIRVRIPAAREATLGFTVDAERH